MPLCIALRTFVLVARSPKTATILLLISSGKFEFFNSLFPLGAFFIATVLVGLIYYVIKEFLIYLYELIVEFSNPTIRLTEEQMVEISEQANSFVHSKHRPWIYDDTFAEYLNLVNEMVMSKQKELSRNC